MYKRILVPLEGSKLAECALPHVEKLAKGGDTEEVILVSVTERVKGYRALEEGVTTDELRHAVLMAFTTAGFPTMIAAMKWVDEVIDKHKKS